MAQRLTDLVLKKNTHHRQRSSPVVARWEMSDEELQLLQMVASEGKATML